MSNTTDIERYVNLLDPKVKQNVTVVTPEELGVEKLIHFSTNPSIREFTPHVSRRTAHKEDRSVPRVSTAPSLAGAILAYQAVDRDFERVREKNGFRGGWYIYGFTYTHALQPNNRVLYDAKATGEIWLVPYNDEQWRLTPTRLGKFFPIEIASSWKKDRWSNRIVFVCHVTDEALQLTPKMEIKKGYHQFTLHDVVNGYSLKDVEVVDYTEISKKEFDEKRRVHASLLSLEETPPAGNW